MKVRYTQSIWNTENYRFFRLKTWLKALNLSVKPMKEKKTEKKDKGSAREAA